MSVHLVGGGRGGDGGCWAPFLEEAGARAGGVPTIVLIAVGAESAEHARTLVEELPGTIRPRILAVGEDADLEDAVLEGAHGVLVGGGLTPAYLRVLLPLGRRLRELVADGVPYAGFSAGSAIAAERALIGGYRIDGVPVVDPDTAEDLDDVTVIDGLGLVPFTIEVHAAQWGTLARLVAAVDAGLVEHGVAVDEHTAVVAGGGSWRVVGAGNAWDVARSDRGAVVRRIR